MDGSRGLPVEQDRERGQRGRDPDREGTQPELARPNSEERERRKLEDQRGTRGNPVDREHEAHGEQERGAELGDRIHCGERMPRSRIARLGSALGSSLSSLGSRP